MKARNLVAYLQKSTNVDTDVTVVVDNKEYAIMSVSNSVGKKILVAEPIMEDLEDDSDEPVEEDKMVVNFTSVQEPKTEKE